MILFNQWRKSGAVALSLLLVFIFTLTTNVVFEMSPVWAESYEEEVYDESEETASDTAKESSGGFFSGIVNWIKSVTGAVNKMWGMENGSGVAMVVNAAFYVLLVLGALFVGKLVFNIINETLNRKVDEKYEKPSFRKK